MELSRRALEQFVVLSEELHFRRAAERLSMTQPPLSQAVQRLERTVGVALLDRTSRTVRLTPAGTAFLRDARAMLAAQDAAVDRARRVAGGETGQLNVGFVAGMAYELLPRLLRGVSESLPGIVVQLHQHASLVLTDMVRGGRIDLAIVRAPLPDTSGLTVDALPSEHLVLAVPRTSRLGRSDAGDAGVGGASIDLVDAANERWALPLASAMPGLAEQALMVCHRAGLVPRVAARADTLIGLLAHVAHGGCVALVPESVRRESPPGVVVRGLVGHDRMTIIENLALRRAGDHDPVLDRVARLLHAARGRRTAGSAEAMSPL